MPTAKTPTAIDSTTSAVRVLFAHRSDTTFFQRGLGIADLRRLLSG
jgi:hypothetical protein